MNTTRAKWGVIGFLAVLLVVAFAGLRYLPSRGVQRQIEAIRAAGLPASPAELDAWYKPVAADDNRALVIIEAAQIRVEPGKNADPNSTRFGSMNAGSPISDELRAAMDAYVTNNQSALRLLHEAAEREGSRYPIDLSKGANTLLPNLAQVKSMVQLLKVDAVRHSARGEPEEAVRSVNAGFAVAASLEQEPLLISDLVRIASLWITINALERVINDHQLSRGQLTDLSRHVAEAESAGGDALYRAYVGERASGLSVFKMSFAELDAVGGGGGSSGPGSVWQVLGHQAYRASGMRQRDLSLYLELMERFVSSCKSGFPEILDRFDEVDKEMSARFSQGLGRFAIFSRMLLPALNKAATKEANITARLRYCLAALAIEQYRLDHNGALPASLEEITPEYLHKLPVDPMDGAALVYERLPSKGYRISGAAAVRRQGLASTVPDLGISVAR